MAIFSNQRIEIPLLLVFFTFMLADVISKNFILYRTCYVILGKNISDCRLLGTNNESKEIKELEEAVQPVASVVMMTRSVIDSVLPVFFSFIVGPWSNKHGRKPILLSSIIGIFFTYLIAVCVSLFTWASPWWWVLGSVVSSLGGGVCSLLTITYCYIADTTTEVERIVKMGMLELYFGIGSVLGTLSSSYVFNAVGYTGVYIICSATVFLSILYLYFCITESLNEVEHENKLVDLFDLSVIADTLKTFFKARPNKQRMLLYLFISLLVLYIFVVFAEDSVFFLFVREKFHWPLVMYTWFSSVNTVVEILATMFVLLVVCKKFHVRDTTIIIYGYTMLCVSSVVYALAQIDWEIFLGSALKRCNIAILPLGRAAISKLIPPDDLGAIFAVTTSLETLVQLISTPLYTVLYNTTLSYDPGAFNFLSAGIFAFCVIITSAIIYVRKQQETTTSEYQQISTS